MSSDTTTTGSTHKPGWRPGRLSTFGTIPGAGTRTTGAAGEGPETIVQTAPLLDSSDEIVNLIYHIPPCEQGQPHDRGYAYHDGRIIRRRYDWDEVGGRFENMRMEYIAFEDGDPDGDFEPWSGVPELGDEIGLIGIHLL